LAVRCGIDNRAKAQFVYVALASGGFCDMHTVAVEQIDSGEYFDVSDTRTIATSLCKYIIVYISAAREFARYAVSPFFFPLFFIAAE
jgi:hypothetical protein